MRVIITMACTECKQRNYTTTKNKKNDPDRVELKKYCSYCNSTTTHRETR
ncbi:50S ribosomal protein L33 [Alicyclobacillus sp. SO9]|nr:50S ribosomal protein L33 [Alicyclobacillus sp. SO9]QQE78545.1 50S ribosomal protein L33 [Alicyclobacillus sp. SO9]